MSGKEYYDGQVPPSHQYNDRSNNMNQPFVNNSASGPGVGYYPNQQQVHQQPGYNPNQAYQSYQPIQQQQGYPQQQPTYPQQNYMPPPNNIVVVTQQPSSPQFVLIQDQTDGYPRLDKTTALVILILNIFFPGIGTMIMGCIGNNAGGFICIGICQLLLTFLLIGWIWSIITGVNALKYARD